MTTQTSLFERIGGAPAVTAAAELFYRKVLADPALAGYFDDVDLDGQVAKQAAFLTMALGGPHAYTGRDLRTAHAPLAGLTDEHVDLVVVYLAQTLSELGVAAADVAAAGAVAESVRDDILNR
ncbi:MAG TPA: group 1 truncated hemoglobin [Streptosporangiaceae bacterium]|jgi:hemoglobin